MRKLTCLLAAASLAAPAAAETRTWDFRVLLDGREIGQHRFTLAPQGEERELKSEASFDVRFLFVSAYRYQHEATERWRGDCLRALASRTETNGEREQVSATLRGERLVVERPGARDEHAGCVMSFAYWNPRILQARELLNSQTGELLPVTITRQGEETLTVRNQTVRAERHRIVARDLQIDLWYANRQWIALESPAKGGRTLRYELR